MLRLIEKEEWGFALCVFGLSSPFYLWGFSFSVIFFLISILLIFLNWKGECGRIRAYLPLFVLLYIVVGLRSNFTIWGTITVFLFWTIFNAKREFLAKSYNNYRLLFSITIIPSILVYLLLLVGVDIPYHIIDPINSVKEGYYRAYPFTILYESVAGYPMFRFHGYYDEPGIVGTIAGLLLITDKMDLKNKWNIPILIAGLLSLSLFFYVLVLFYILFFSQGKTKAFLVTFAIILLILLVRLSDDNPYIAPFINRFIIEDGKFSGDTRTSYSFDIWFNRFIYSSDFWIGLGGNKAQEVNIGGSSYKDLIVNYGFIFFITYILSFINYIVSLCKRKRTIILCLFLFLCCIYQRPAIYDFFYMFLWCGAICTLSLRDENYLAEHNGTKL